jgi:phosphopantetheinyl transferase (holo-ACP synthase)
MPEDRPSIPSIAEGPSASGESAAPVLSRVEKPLRGIGIGIESVASFPEAENYLEDAFYTARFSPAELASCAGQSSPRSSFCALLAVKRAVVRAGAAPASSESLAALEITIDDTGEPSFPDCLLSVDRTDTTAVAVCLRAPASPAPVPMGRPLSSFPPLQRIGIRVVMGLAGFSLLFVFGAGIWFILTQIFE